MKILFVGIILVLVAGIAGCLEVEKTSMTAKNESVQIASGGINYPAYLASPATEGPWPAVVLIHSFRGLEPGYRVMTDRFASDGFVVIAPEWQTFNNTPKDDVVAELIADSVAYLKTRKDVDSERLGLTGFCAGGRYTMLFLPQIEDFRSGVAWYGFPYSGGFANQSRPVEFIDQLKAPLLIIHGTYDQASKISDIYQYAMVLNDSGKYFEMKVYQGEPHGFMIENGQLSQSMPAKDAFQEMINFFRRTL